MQYIPAACQLGEDLFDNIVSVAVWLHVHSRICVTSNLMWIFGLRQSSECLRLSPREVMRRDELLAELCLSVHQNSMIPKLSHKPAWDGSD